MKPVHCNTGLKEKCLILVKKLARVASVPREGENRMHLLPYISRAPSNLSRAGRKFPFNPFPCVTYIDKDNFKQILGRRFSKKIKNFSCKVLGTPLSYLTWVSESFRHEIGQILTRKADIYEKSVRFS